MNSPQETQLGHDLHRLASGESYTPDLAEIKQLARQRHHRTLVRRGATAAGAVVLASGGLFVGVHGFSSDHGTTDTAVGQAASTGASTTPSQSATAGATPRLETVAYVAKQVEAALASVNGDIIRDDQAFTGEKTESGTNWTDSRTGNEFNNMTNKASGKWLGWLNESTKNGVFTGTEVVADYSSRTWFTVTLRSTLHQAQGSSVNVTSPVMTPAEIKSWADSGKLKIVGHQTINGHATIGLRGPWGPYGYRELWVDSQTFLPVRVFVDYYAAPNTGLTDLKLTGDLTWLPRTDSLVNTVNKVHIPAGFRHVATPR